MHCRDMNNAALETISAKIKAAESANRSASKLNRLWRQYFAVESALKAGAFLP